MASTEIRERRRTLRYRHLLVRQVVQMKNKISGLLMETGVSYNKQRLHKVGYFGELLSTNEEVHENIRPLLRLCRETIVRCRKRNTLWWLSERDPLLAARVERLRTDSRSRTHHRTYLGAGDRGCNALPVIEASDQLLRTVRRGKEFRRQGHANTAFQTTQQAYATCTGRSGETSAQTEP